MTSIENPSIGGNRRAAAAAMIAANNSSSSAIASSSNNPNSNQGGVGGNRNTNRYSVTALYSLAAENDLEVEDDLARAQKRLRELKGRISTQSKKNFVLERDVRYLDSRIALLIQNRMALDEVSEREG